MKKFLIIATIIILSLAVFIGGIVYIIMLAFEEEKEIVSKFVIYSSSKQYEAASDLMHDALKTEFPISKFEESFRFSKPYVDTSFSSMHSTGSVTTLEGIARTEDECSSKLDFEILDGKITRFNITPLCK